MEHHLFKMAECYTPMTIVKKTTGQSIAVPCGKCPACLARRTSAWSFRLMQEEKRSSNAQFITLTYDTVHAQITPNGFMTLHKPDFQNFMKALRKLNPEKKLKYYAVGEYGGKSKRPHYHIILFNHDVTTIQRAWKMGSTHYGTVTGASVGYTLKYLSKKSQIPQHKNDDRQPEFSLMSKGLGDNYLTPQMKKWHTSDNNNRMYCNLTDGKKISMPRYYKDKIYTDEQRKAAAYASRKKMLEQLDKNELVPEYHYELFLSRKQQIDNQNIKKHDNEKI